MKKLFNNKSSINKDSMNLLNRTDLSVQESETDWSVSPRTKVCASLFYSRKLIKYTLPAQKFGSPEFTEAKS